MNREILQTCITLSYTIYSQRKNKCTENILEIVDLSDFFKNRLNENDASNNSMTTTNSIYLKCAKLPTLVIDNDKKRLYLVFPGCENLKEWCHNYVNSFKTTLDGNIMVHNGIHQNMYSYEIIQKTILELIHDKRYREYQLVTCGHSLGGMHALLFAYNFSKSNQNIQTTCITFGCARLGNKPFKDDFESLINLSHYRCFNKRDPVSYWPFYGYHHVGIPVLIDNGEIQCIQNNNTLLSTIWKDSRMNICTWLYLDEHKCSNYYLRITDPGSYEFIHEKNENNKTGNNNKFSDR